MNNIHEFNDNHAWYKFLWNLGHDATVKGGDIYDDKGNLIAVNNNYRKRK